MGVTTITEMMNNRMINTVFLMYDTKSILFRWPHNISPSMGASLIVNFWLYNVSYS
jgi:hypothetical protein